MKTRSGKQFQTSTFLNNKIIKRKFYIKKTNSKIKQIKIYRAVCVIQRWWRSFKFINNTDFVTLEPLSGRTFHIKTEARHIYRFNVLNLANYYLNEGNFINPYNRQPIRQQDLVKLDKHVQSIDPSFQSLVSLKQKIIVSRQQQRQHEEICQYLHGQCFQILIQSLSTFTNVYDDQSLAIAIFHYQYTALPSYFDTFRQLFEYDDEFACESITSIIDELNVLMPDTYSMFNCLLLIFIRDKLKKFVAQILPILPLIINVRS